MKKRMLSILLCIALLSPLAVSGASDPAVIRQGDTGSEVYAIQRRLCDLGYLNYRPTGKFSDMTTGAVRKFQQVNGIAADGRVGQSTLRAIYSENAVRNAPNPEFKRVTGIAYTGQVTKKGALSAWETIDREFNTGDTATVTDYNSGRSFKVKRVGGENCAAVAPDTAEDFETYTAVCNGQTWEHRAVLVSIGGTEYAASIFGMPTNTGAVSASGMEGYTTLYFNNSKTDVYAIPDEEHVLAIARIS